MILRNDGRRFEKMLEHIFDAYRSTKEMDVRKTEPPCRTVGTGHKRQVIFLENPWTDFTGCWTERSGRMIALEAKSTSEDRLSIGKSGGVTERQFLALMDWAAAGAAVGVLWDCPSGVFFVSLAACSEVANSRTRLQPENCIKIPSGNGFIVYDIAQVLRQLY